MKTILVPTDFSKCAGFAIDAAMGMAKQFNAKVFLFHLTNLPDGWESMTQPDREMSEAYQLWRDAHLQFDKVQKKYPKVEVERLVSGGKIDQRVQEVAAKYSIDLIVMGSHGTSGRNQYFIGSNTQKVVRKVHRPVLVVKSPLKSVNFKKVVFASGFDLSEKEVFLHFKDFVKPFSPEIHLVAIHTSLFFDVPYAVQKEAMDEFKTLCEPLSSKIHIYRDYSVDKGIREWSNELGAELIAISNHIRHPFKRMLAGSTVEAIVNHSYLPVLTIDFEK